jgi:hypothetical protein
MRQLAIASAMIPLLGAATPGLAASPAQAACLLPIPDGGGEDYKPSKENLWSDIERVELPFVHIKSGTTHKTVKVSLAKIKEAYTVYGGPADFSTLKPKLQVRVWFENCRAPKNGVPNVAYFQYFSDDPKDRATLDKNGEIIAVPPMPPGHRVD